jgi:hypothetical protein
MYFFTPKRIFQQRRAYLVLAIDPKPIICIGLLCAKVGCNSAILGRLDGVSRQLVCFRSLLAHDCLFHGWRNNARHGIGDDVGQIFSDAYPSKNNNLHYIHLFISLVDV